MAKKELKTHFPSCPMEAPDGSTVYLTLCGRVVEPERTSNLMRVADCERCWVRVSPTGELR